MKKKVAGYKSQPTKSGDTLYLSLQCAISLIVIIKYSRDKQKAPCLRSLSLVELDYMMGCSDSLNPMALDHMVSI